MIIPFIKENKLLIKIDICYIITFLINCFHFRMLLLKTFITIPHNHSL